MPETIFLRLLQDEDKAAALAAAVNALQAGEAPAAAYAVDPGSFQQIPGAPFAYWVSEKMRDLFTQFEKTESDGRVVTVSNESGDDFRFIRLWNEISPNFIGQKRIWVPHAKGGRFSPFYADIYLLIGWDDENQTYPGYKGSIHRPDLRPASAANFFRCGLTWPRRTNGLSFRVLPSGCIFGNKGPGIFVPGDAPDKLLALNAICNSIPFGILVAMQLGRVSLAQSYEVGLIQQTPVPDLTGPEGKRLGGLALACVDLKRDLDRANETSHVFHLPALLQAAGATLAERLAGWRARVDETDRRLAENQREIDEIAFQLYGIDGADRQAIEESLSAKPATAEDDDEAEPEGDEAASAPLDGRALAAELVSYAVGAAFGRWDVRYATGERPAPELWDPFAPLPACAPGMLTGAGGLPERSAPAGYPLPIADDGILADDPEHPADLARRVRAVLHLIFAERVDAIEREICGLLGVAELRDYLRRPAKGGFWLDHVARYSKSRRKAPIYWLLQSPKKLYGLWLDYHRLDSDILFKALVNYVEPKIRLERSGLADLQAQKQAAEGREARQIEKQIEKQETLLNDLETFREQLERAAQRYLAPDHNDGVVLTIAPLWELTPWPVAKTYWGELLAGKHEWSSIGRQLREKGMVKQ